MLKSHIALEKNNYVDSLKGFESCLKLDFDKKNHGYFYYWIGRVYDYYGFDKKNPVYDTEKADVFYEKALKNKNYPPDLILKLLRRKTESAQKILIERGIREFPQFITFYVRLFSISKLTKNVNLLKTLQEGFTKTQSYTIGLLIGKYYEENGDFNDAISHYNEYLKSITDESEKNYFYQSLGTTLFKSGKLTEAIESFDKILESSSGHFIISTFLQLAYISFCDNNKQLALSYLERIQINENFFQIDLNENLAWLESEYPTELKNIIDFKDFEKKLRTARKENNGEIKENISLVLVLILKHNDKHYDRFRVLKQIVNDYTQDYLLEEYIESYSDYFNYLNETNRNIKNLYTNLITDISSSHSIKEKLVSSYILKSIIKHLFKKTEYGKVIRISNLLNHKEITKVDFWFELAYSYGETGDTRNALKAYEHEIKENPK